LAASVWKSVTRFPRLYREELKFFITMGVIIWYYDNWVVVDIFCLGQSEISTRTYSSPSQKLKGLREREAIGHGDGWFLRLSNNQQLIGLVDRFGQERWTSNSQKIGNRSDIQCRYWYIQLKQNGGNIGIQSVI
jgi:hypothetical protein